MAHAPRAGTGYSAVGSRRYQCSFGLIYQGNLSMYGTLLIWLLPPPDNRGQQLWQACLLVSMLLSGISNQWVRFCLTKVWFGTLIRCGMRSKETNWDTIMLRFWALSLTLVWMKLFIDNPDKGHKPVNSLGSHNQKSFKPCHPHVRLGALPSVLLTLSLWFSIGDEDAFETTNIVNWFNPWVGHKLARQQSRTVSWVLSDTLGAHHSLSPASD